MARDGYVNNNTRLWCYRPDVLRGFTELRGLLMRESTLTEREIAVLVTATASAGSDSYCALAWAADLPSSRATTRQPLSFPDPAR